MSRTGRLLVVVAAWVAPVAWVVVALLSGPSDGTVVDRWGSSATIVETFGDGPLRPGDVVLAVDGRTLGEWASGAVEQDRAVGDVVVYEVRRPDPDLALERAFDVTLTAYPLTDAVTDRAAAVLAGVLLLLAGSVVFWRRPGSAPGRAFLACSALVPAGLTATPWGVGAIDLAGSRGTWPAVAGAAVCALGLGAAVVAAAMLPPSRAPAWSRAPAALLPVTGFATWSAIRGGTPPALTPALVVAAALVLALVAWAYARAEDRTDALASRLVLVALLGGISTWLLLGELPRGLSGSPLLPWDVLVLLLTPAVLGCLVVALVGYRLDEIEPTVRRALVQALVAALVGTLFVAVAAAVGRASDISFDSLLAGGVVALLLLPLAVALQRAMRRAVYGDRELPHRVVSDLRRLDASSAPEEALTETLALLARRLRLSHAAIDVQPADGSEPVVAAIGEPAGRPVTIDLVAGGSELGTLRLEVAAHRDPFGPGDRRLLEDVGSQVGALVQAVLVNRELQRSRQHLVSAREEERRRLRRDLHDGLGPSLATLAMRLDAAHDLVASDPTAATDLLERLAEQARGEISEVRRLVDGLRPPALDQFGLVAALRQRAEEQRVPGRPGAQMTWTVEADEDVEPLPAAVEVAAYRIALEAVTNARRHSGAESCTVTLRREDGSLRLRVRDTGRGLAAVPGTGVGLTSMRERAEELGGTCTVTSDGTGTTVDAWLPFPTDGG